MKSLNKRRDPSIITYHWMEVVSISLHEYIKIQKGHDQRKILNSSRPCAMTCTRQYPHIKSFCDHFKFYIFVGIAWTSYNMYLRCAFVKPYWENIIILLAENLWPAERVGNSCTCYITTKMQLYWGNSGPGSKALPHTRSSECAMIT